MARKTVHHYASNSAVVLFGLAIGLVVAALYWLTYHRGSQRAEWPQAQVPILEVRTVLIARSESERGSAAVFQAEAHVDYDVEKGSHDRWLPILLPSASKQSLAIELATLKKQPCYIHWNPARPDDAFLTCSH